MCSVVWADNTEWVLDTPKSLWKKIVDEVAEYYGYTLEWYVLLPLNSYMFYYTCFFQVQALDPSLPQQWAYSFLFFF